jgi:hypothetical protein
MKKCTTNTTIRLEFFSCKPILSLDILGIVKDCRRTLRGEVYRGLGWRIAADIATIPGFALHSLRLRSLHSISHRSQK